MCRERTSSVRRRVPGAPRGDTGLGRRPARPGRLRPERLNRPYRPESSEYENGGVSQVCWRVVFRSAKETCFRGAKADYLRLLESDAICRDEMRKLSARRSGREFEGTSSSHGCGGGVGGRGVGGRKALATGRGTGGLGTGRLARRAPRRAGRLAGRHRGRTSSCSAGDGTPERPKRTKRWRGRPGSKILNIESLQKGENGTTQPTIVDARPVESTINTPVFAGYPIYIVDTIMFTIV